ncbi:hypothetical protein HMPREF0972_01812 [Actinomyces sp. oral taxon 848 str. F0332]|nr:hypothetical protein HMPREF0972_01812 [Actinomyces sp. oral taxon 848 str. F0332]
MVVIPGSPIGRRRVGLAVNCHLGKANRTCRCRLGPFVSRGWGSSPSNMRDFDSKLPTGEV